MLIVSAFCFCGKRRGERDTLFCAAADAFIEGGEGHRLFDGKKRFQRVIRRYEAMCKWLHKNTLPAISEETAGNDLVMERLPNYAFIVISPPAKMNEF
ncbi:hypothetical protein LJC45_03345 [Alistipes sp. OttesenSCG-928-B03]|nr:hypothetical protein [Alistipes sp. OttesenSCG-928-B03]